jgi:hypothetical protein
MLADTYGPRIPILLGSFLHVFGLMMTSISKEYYQFFLAQSVCSAIGCSFLFFPSTYLLMHSPPHYFVLQKYSPRSSRNMVRTPPRPRLWHHRLRVQHRRRHPTHHGLPSHPYYRLRLGYARNRLSHPRPPRPRQRLCQIATPTSQTTVPDC